MAENRRPNRRAGNYSTKTPTKALQKTNPKAETACFVDILDKYELKYVYRLHFRQDANDCIDMTVPQINCARFAPPVAHADRDHILATCGSNSVCFVDCDSGQVFLKYLHLDEPNEVFNTLAWTVVEEKEAQVRVLAVAGEAKTIKLIDFEQEACFRYLNMHQREVTCLEFSAVNPYWLFSAGGDRVCWWDIGAISDDKKATCLSYITMPSGHDIYSMCLTYDTSRLLVGGKHCSIKQFDVDKKKHKLTKSTVFDSEDWHKSPTDDIIQVTQDEFLSKGCKDGKFIVWELSKATKTQPPIEAIERKIDSSEVYGIKGAVVEISPDDRAYIVGSPHGDILVYDLSQVGDDIVPDSASKYDECSIGPCHKFTHKQSTELIRYVGVSKDLEYIVAADDSDCLWIYSRLK